MRRSLSALLPVRNGEASVAFLVEELLEILPELTPRFELIIVDDGSTDATIEQADEIARRYPQVRILRHNRPLGRAAALRTALRHSGGDVVFLRDENCRLPLDQLARLWRASAEYPAVLARAVALHRPQWLRWLPSSAAEGGFQLVERGTLEGIVDAAVDQPTLIAALARRGVDWCEVEMPGRHGAPGGVPRPLRPERAVPIA